MRREWSQERYERVAVRVENTSVAHEKEYSCLFRAQRAYTAAMDAERNPGDTGLRDLSGIEVMTRQTLADGVYDRLRIAITRGDLPEGTELKQAQLAAQLGVSRVPIREALRRLQAEQLVVGNPFRHFLVTSLTPAHVMDLLDLRELLEVFVLTKSLESRQLRQRIEDSKRAAEHVAAQPPSESFLEADREFHRTLNGNTPGAAMIEDTRERVHRYIHSAWKRETSEILQSERRDEILNEHQTLIEALESSDAQKIQDAVHAHICGTRELIQNSFMESERNDDDEPDGTHERASVWKA